MGLTEERACELYGRESIEVHVCAVFNKGMRNCSRWITYISRDKEIHVFYMVGLGGGGSEVLK